MFCKICGTQLSDDSNFCAVCGTKVELIQPGATVAPVAPAKKKVKPIAIILPIIAVILVAAIVLGFVFLGGKNSSDDKETDKENITSSVTSDDTDNENDVNSQLPQTDKAPEEKYYIPVKYKYTSDGSSDFETSTGDFIWSADTIKSGEYTYKFNADGQMTECIYDSLYSDYSYKKTYVYSDGKLSEDRSDDGSTYFYSYDSNGNITNITMKYGNEVDWAKNCSYDSQNRLTKSVVVGDDDEFNFEYSGDKSFTVTAYKDTPDYFVCTSYYNEYNQIEKRFSNENEHTKAFFEYDENNNLTAINISSTEEGDEYIEIIWEEGTKEQAAFVKNNMDIFVPYDAAFYLTNEELMNETE